MFSFFVDIEWKQKQKDDTCLNIERIIRWEKQLRRVMWRTTGVMWRMPKVKVVYGFDLSGFDGGSSLGVQHLNNISAYYVVASNLN